jgi:hypothetical protein
MRSRFTLATVVVALLAGAVLAGCGSSGSSGVSPNAWIKSVCTAVVPFQKDVSARGTALNFAGSTNVADVKQKLQSFMTAIVADSSHAVTQLQSAGTPNVPNGKTIATTLVNTFAQIKTAFTKAQSQVNGLPTNSPAAFQVGAQNVVLGIRSSFNGLGSSLSSLKSPELDKAAKATPACAGLLG